MPISPGYYPGFSTLAQRDSWDESTKAAIEKRLKITADTPLRFFSPTEASLLQSVLDVVLPQSDRAQNMQIPILPMIDQRLADKRFNGYILEGSVEDDQAHRLGLAAIAEQAVGYYSRPFEALNLEEKETLLIAIKDGTPLKPWSCEKQLPSGLYWRALLEDAIAAYYSHPYAWDEIGFGGPAYPRGYMRLTDGLPEPWEVDEQRYDWSASEGSRSDHFEENTAIFSENYLKKAKP